MDMKKIALISLGAVVTFLIVACFVTGCSALLMQR